MKCPHCGTEHTPGTHIIKPFKLEIVRFGREVKARVVKMECCGKACVLDCIFQLDKYEGDATVDDWREDICAS